MDSPQMYDNGAGHAGNGAVGGGPEPMKKAGTPNQGTPHNNNNNLTTLNNNSTKGGGAALLKQHQLAAYQAQGELSDLATPEISLDLQNLIDDSQFSEGLFTDILSAGPKAGGGGRAPLPTAVMYPRTTLAYMPQPVHSGAGFHTQPGSNSDSNSSDVPSIKEEPIDPHEYRRPHCQQITNGWVLH